MPYWNITGVGNVTRVDELITNVNTQVLYGYGGISIIGAMGVITFVSMVMITQDAPKSFLVTSWVLFIASLMSWPLGLVPVWWVVLSLVGLAFSAMFLARRE